MEENEKLVEIAEKRALGLRSKLMSELINKITPISSNRDKIKKLCEDQGITVKELTLSMLDVCSESLQDIRNKISAGEELVNEDWLEVAVPFNSIVNILTNHWYKDEK